MTSSRVPQDARSRSDDFKPVSEWDRAALRPEKYFAQTTYVTDFLALAGVREGESVIDIGCGPGTLTLPLARAGHHVTAIDFSDGMLTALKRFIEGADLPVMPVLASWDDNWEALGVVPADVALASRSIIHSDMDFVVTKMSAFARRRAVLTITELGMPREDARILALFGKELVPNPDCIAIIGALGHRGFTPEIGRIVSLKRDTYADLDAAVVASARAAGVSSDREIALLREYLQEHLVEDRDTDGTPRVAKDYERPVTWAFIAWDVGSQK